MVKPEPENILQRYEYFILGRVPIRIAYNQDDNPYIAEVPSSDTGELIVDNEYIIRILMEAPDNLYQIPEDEYEQALKTIKKART